MFKPTRLVRVLVVASILGLAACGGGGSGGGGSGGGGSGGGGSGGGGSGGGGSGGGGSGGGSSNVPQAQLGPNLGQALLGPIVDATVSVYAADNFDGVAVCSVTTSSDDAPEGPGVIDLGSCTIDDSAVYLLVVEGGSDIDADDDGIIDAAPTPKEGALRAVISGQSILAGDFRVNIVTEIAYHGVLHSFLAGARESNLMDRLDGLARQLLSQDLNGDGVVDNEDLLDFSPLNHGQLIPSEYAALLDDILAAILSGNRHELTKLARELLLASLGEYSFIELLEEQFQNLLIIDFEVDDGFIYAAGFDVESPENDLRVFVFDAVDFAGVSLVGQYSNEIAVNPQSAALELLKVGNFLYVVSQGNGLFVIDVSDPSAPDGTLLFPGDTFTGLAIRDESTMYMSYDEPFSPSNRGIHVVDITDQQNPQIVGSIDNLTVFDMLYAESVLYVYGAGLSAFDASQPTSLAQLDSISFPAGSHRNIAYSNGFVYVPITDTAIGLQGMTIIDAQDPQNLQRVDDISGIGFITQIGINEDMLYATTSTGSGSTSYMLVSFEIGPNGLLQMVDSRSSPTAFYLRTEGDRVYLASGTQLTAYDTQALSNKTEHLASLATDKSANLVEVVGGTAFVANDTELLAIDVSDPESGLTVLGAVSVIDWINDMVIDGENHYAYLANATEGIKIVDISDPSNLQVVGSNSELVPFYDPENDQEYFQEAFAIAVQGDSAYTVHGGFPTAIVGVFNISDPAAPTVLRSAVFPYPIGDVAVKNETLYGVDKGPGAQSFYVVDVEDEPTHLETIDLLSRALERVGDYLYTTSGTAGLSILNIGNERDPVLFGGTLSLGIGNALSVEADLAYVANEFGMVEIYSLVDRTRPALIGQYPVSGVVKDVFATAEYVFAVNGLGLIVERAASLHNAL